MIIGRDVLLGADPYVIGMALGALIVAICGGFFALFWALMRALGWAW